MEPLLPLRPQLIRQANQLHPSSTKLSLMSVVIPSLPRQAMVAVVLAAVTPSDLIGSMSDGSVGIFTLRVADAAEIDRRFLQRLQVVLTSTLSPNFGTALKIWFRSVHRAASEIADAEDLIDLLFATSAQCVAVAPTPHLAGLPATGQSHLSR